MTATDFDRTASVFAADTLDRVRSENWFSPLTVVRKTWAPSVTVEDAMRGDVPADEVFLSADGHSFERQAELRTQIDAIVADLEGDAAGHERNVQETHTASSEVQS